MQLRPTRRGAVQAVLTAAAAATLSQSKISARQSTPDAAEAATISTDQVNAAVAQLDDMVDEAMARTGVPGAAVAVVHDDSVVYQRAFGVREAGKADPVTTETVFQLASMSKAISSTLVAAAVGDGAVTWDTVVADHLSGFALADPWWTSQVTIRDLFSHRSGLPAYAGDGLTATFGYDREEAVRRLRHIPPASAPRSAFAYTNLGLSAAAYAAAEAVGTVWEDLAEERLFAPLGMTASSYRFADYVSNANSAAPHYRTRAGNWALGDVTAGDAAAAAGGVSTNIQDLTRWVRLQLGGGVFEGSEVVNHDALMETRRPHILEGSPADPADGPALFYGLGWRLHYDERGRLHVHHIGDFSSGFRTGVNLLPAAGLGIVILSNAWPNALADAIPRAFLETVDHGQPSADWVGIYEEQTATALAAVSAMAPFPPGDAPAGEPPLNPEAYTGTYNNRLYGVMEVRDMDGSLVLEGGPQPFRLELTHWDRDVFTYPLPPSGEVLLGRLGVQFTIGPTGTATAIALGLPTVGPDGTAHFSRVDSPA